jgi:hypothetical protein
MSTSKPSDFADHTDPELEEFEGHLLAIYTARTIPEYPTWSQLRAEHAAVAADKRWAPILRWVRPRPFRSHRFAPLPALLALLLVATAAAYGGRSLILNQLAQGEPGTKSLTQQALFTPIHQSKTIDGFTASLEEAYADANRAVLGIVVKKPDLTSWGQGGSWTFRQMNLKTTSGVILPAGYFFLNDEAFNQGESPTETFASFDAETIQGTPGTLHLQVDITYGCSGTSTSPCSEKALSVSQDLNWSFQFDVPFHPGRVANLHQAITHAGTTMTLERVVVTPSESRAYLTGLSYTDDSFSTLTIAGKTYVVGDVLPVGGFAVGVPQSTEVYVSFYVPLFDQHGTWTLSVKIWVPGVGGACQCEGTLKGLWSFQFVVP